MSVPRIGPAAELPSTANDGLGAQPIKAAATTNHAVRVIARPQRTLTLITLPARGGRLQAQLSGVWPIVATVSQFNEAPSRLRSGAGREVCRSSFVQFG